MCRIPDIMVGKALAKRSRPEWAISPEEREHIVGRLRPPAGGSKKMSFGIVADRKGNSNDETDQPTSRAVGDGYTRLWTFRFW